MCFLYHSVPLAMDQEALPFTSSDSQWMLPQALWLDCSNEHTYWLKGYEKKCQSFSLCYGPVDIKQSV